MITFTKYHKAILFWEMSFNPNEVMELKILKKNSVINLYLLFD